MEHDGGKSVGRCKKAKDDFRLHVSYTSTDFLNYGASVPLASEKYFFDNWKKNETNKQTE